MPAVLERMTPDDCDALVYTMPRFAAAAGEPVNGNVMTLLWPPDLRRPATDRISAREEAPALSARTGRCTDRHKKRPARHKRWTIKWDDNRSYA